MEIISTPTFDKWLGKFKNGSKNKSIVELTIKSWKIRGNIFGDIKSVGKKVYEVRFHFGAGYRIYYTYRGSEIILLLVGGDKSSQARDIAKAQAMAAHRRESK